MEYDVFISYAHEDREQAERLARSLSSHGLKVFFDRISIGTGARYHDMIDAVLNQAKCIVVLCSRKAIVKEWVRDEAAHALERGNVVPCILDDLSPSELPFRFRNLQLASLADWRGERDHAGFGKVRDAIGQLIRAKSLDLEKHWLTRADHPLLDEVESFVPSAEMREAVQLAIQTQSLALIMGEYGTPKIKLPMVVASEHGMPLFMFYADEASDPKELLYRYDGKASASDERMMTFPLRTYADEEAETSRYIEKGPMWLALEASTPAVLGIYGMERTDLIFQLRLLDLVETLTFTVQETGQVIRGRPECRPLVIMLHEFGTGVIPDQRLLRRSVCCVLEPATREELITLANSRFRSDDSIPEEMLSTAVDLFLTLRRRSDMRLMPTVADLVQWINVLLANGRFSELHDINPDVTPVMSIPFLQLLVRDPRDIQQIRGLREAW